MTKTELVNKCIDLSYNVSKEELKGILKNSLNRSYMQTKDSKKDWETLFNEMNKITSEENGSSVLFVGSNVEHYRIK